MTKPNYMKSIFKCLLLLAAMTVLPSGAMASDSQWYLYFYSSANGLDGDAGRFQTAETDGIFLLENCVVPASGINFCVRNEDWSVKYGWADGGSVVATATAYPLAAADGATGWMTLPAGAYDVVFDAFGRTIEFNRHAPDAVSYTTFPDGHALAEVSGYMRGADISMLSYVESLGAKFYDADGTEKDALDIMQSHGINTVRLRLYNNPGQTVTYTPEGGTPQTYALPAGFLDQSDILSLARRAKAHNMKIVLTFHYSDFWTNGELQLKPKEWESLSFAELQTALHDYTYNFLQQMNRQGTPPEYVALGNEIQSGLLFGCYTSSKSQIAAVNGYCDNMSSVAALLSSGSTAVREACPEAKVVVHLTLSSAITADTYQWFFDAMKSNGLDYDVIGTSYYPYWTNQRPAMLTALADAMFTRYGKPLLAMEVGYSWTPYKPSGRYGGNYEGQLHLNGTAYNEASQAGQKSFISELQAVVKNNDHIQGYIYWDPVMVEQKVGSSWIKTGWVKGGDNLVGNTTLFDYNGKALPVFEAIGADAAELPSGKVIDGHSYTIERQPPFILQMPAVGYSTFFSAHAYTVPDGLTAYTAAAAAAGTIELRQLDGDVVPAATGLLLHGDAGTYYLWPRHGNTTPVAGNLLRGTQTEQTIAPETGSYRYYKLVDDATHGLGWYWGAADGGVFTNNANKAYLALPSAGDAPAFISLFGSTTGVEALQQVPSAGAAPTVYSLTGQRVARPQRGLYIVNGRKTVVGLRH